MRTIFPVAACALLLSSSAAATALVTKSSPKHDGDVARGRYLVKIAGCNDCHKTIGIQAHEPEFFGLVVSVKRRSSAEDSLSTRC